MSKKDQFYKMSSDHAHYWSVFFCVDSLCLSSWDFSIEHVFASVYPAIWQVCSDDICSVASDPSDHSYFAGRDLLSSGHADVWQWIWAFI